MKICVAGVGAVGGVLSAMLGQNPDVELSLIARGRKAEAFETNGVVLHSDFYGERTARPVRIAQTGEQLGKMDAILICVKNYSLDTMIELIRPSVGADTVLIPVMNGIEAPERLRKAFPGNIVGESCIYTISFMQEDCSIRQKGTYTFMYAGTSEAKNRARVQEVLDAIAATGFDLRQTDDPVSEMWQKFILNCAFNTITACCMTDSGHIRADDGLRSDAHALLNEAAQIGFLSGVHLPEDIVQQKFQFMMNKQSEDATSSMRRDLEAGLPIELDAFSGSVIRKAEEFGIEVPVTKRYHEALRQKTNAANR